MSVKTGASHNRTARVESNRIRNVRTGKARELSDGERAFRELLREAAQR